MVSLPFKGKCYLVIVVCSSLGHQRPSVRNKTGVRGWGDCEGELRGIRQPREGYWLPSPLVCNHSSRCDKRLAGDYPLQIDANS